MSKHISLFSRKPIIATMFNWNSALTIFVCTVFAYVVAILYESTYLSAFGLGPDLIEISPVVIFYSIVTLVIAYGFIELESQFHYYFTYEDKILRSEGRVYKRFLYLVLDFATFSLYTIAFLSIITGVIISSIGTSTIYAALYIFAGSVAVVILIPIIFGAKEMIASKSLSAGLASYFNRLDKSRESVELKKNKKEPFLNERAWSCIVLIAIALSLPGIYATASAHAEKSYYVWSSNGDIKSLVVKHYGKDIIIKDYDTRKKKFLDGFTLANTDETRNFKEKYTIEKWSN